MRSTRMRRMDDQFKRVLGEAILTKVQDPRIGFVSVLGVKVSPEFDTARVFVSIMGTEEEREQSMLGLRSAAPFLQSEIGKSLRVRRVPRLRFVYDDSVDRSFRIQEALADHAPEPEEDAPGDEEAPA